MTIQAAMPFRGSKADKELLAIFDPETLYSFLPEDFAKEIGGICNLPKPKLMGIAHEDKLLLISHATCAEFKINDVRLSDEFMLLPGNYNYAIIGITTIRKWRLQLDQENNSVIVNPEVGRFRLGGLREIKK